jgi:hypothetical protein
MNDENRAADGQWLRQEWLDEHASDGISPSWSTLGCSMLEMLIALARRAEYLTSGISPSDWFWIMVDNIGLKKYTDAMWGMPFTEEFVNDAIEMVIFRTYNYDGSGGLFPLAKPETDQTKVELTYQLNGYILENMPY